MKLKEFIRKSLLKPWDVIIILFLILISFTPVVFFFYLQENIDETIEYQAVLKVDGQVLESFELTEEQQAYTYRYEDDDGDFNLIEIDGKRVRISEASCGDQICVRQGWISKSGQTIVCLPHKLVIEIRASDGSEDGGMIY